MKVYQLIEELKKMPKNADVTTFCSEDDDVREIIDVHVLEEDESEADIVEIVLE